VKILDRARKVYADEESPRALAVDILLHIANPQGWVVSRPDLLILARPVRKDAKPEEILDAGWEFHEADCWHIYLVVGNASTAFQYLPFDLPWISFERKNKLRFYELTRVRSLLG
jgi:hypothetical protein